MQDNTIIRVVKRERYAVIDKYFLDEDSRLSWKATGQLTYLLGKPNGWEVKVSDLIVRKKDKRDSVRAGLRELIQAGYLERKPVRDNGKFNGYCYVVHEIPIKPVVEQFSPETENPSPVKPSPENHPLVNTSIKNNKYRDQQQLNRDFSSIVDQSDHEKSVVVDIANQLNSVEEIMAYAKGKGIEVFEDCARDFLDAAASSERAKKAVDWAAEVAASKVRRGERVRNPAGLLFKGLHINSGAKLDPESLDSERKKRLAEKEDRYKDLYLS